MLHLAAQEYFDRVEFDPTAGYKELGARDQKIRHIQLHVAKAAMKLISRDEEVVIGQVIPDTAIYRSQIINLISEPVREKLVKVLEPGLPVTLVGDETGFTVDNDASYEYFQGYIVKATGNLATYLERLEHGEQGDEYHLRHAAINLNTGSRGLAKLYDIDLDQAHLSRLEENLGHPIPADLS